MTSKFHSELTNKSVSSPLGEMNYDATLYSVLLGCRSDQDESPGSPRGGGSAGILPQLFLGPGSGCCESGPDMILYSLGSQDWLQRRDPLDEGIAHLAEIGLYRR